MKRLIFLVEGNPDDPHNFSGIPYYFSRALRPRLLAAGVALRVVDTSYLLNVQELLDAVRVLREGNGLTAVMREIDPVAREHKLSFQLNAALLNRAGDVGEQEFVAALRTYYKSVKEHVLAQLSSIVQPGDTVLSQNHFYPYLGNGWPVFYYLDASLVDFYFHDTFGTASPYRSTPHVRSLYLEMEREALRDCRGIFCFSSILSRDLRRRYGIPADAFSTVGAGINFNTFPRPRARVSRQTLQLLFVGLDYARKGGEVLMDAMGRLADDQLHLTLVTRSTLNRNELPRNVTVHSECDKFQLANLYRRADVFVFPTLFEPFGVAVCEAMAFSLPIIATRGFAIPEILGPRASRLLVDPGDAVGLAEAIRYLFSNPDLRAQIGRWNYRRARRRYQWKWVADRIIVRCLSDSEAGREPEP
jgi:glycosyltransferase involved in cell wall biosynthesis